MRLEDLLEVDGPRAARPWRKFAGMFNDNPLLDEAVEEVEEVDVSSMPSRNRAKGEAAGLRMARGHRLYSRFVASNAMMAA